MSITVFELECLAKDDIHIPRDSYIGYPLRNLVYTIIEGVDHEYFTEIHSGGAVAPFAVKPPIGAQRGRISILRWGVGGGSLFKFEVRCLNERFAKTFLKGISEVSVINLAGGDAEIIAVKAHTIESAVILSEAEKLSKHKRLLVSFRTPTVLRLKVKGRDKHAVLFPLPDPRLIFTNLHMVWNSYMKPRISKRYLTWLNEMGICPAALLNVRTVRLFEYEKNKRKRFDIGFIGRARFALVEELYDKTMATYTYALLKFAEYSNIGKGRTAGLGVVRLLRPTS